MSRQLAAVVVGMVVLTAGTGTLQAGTILIPNGSFESPQTDFASPLINSWQQIPPPDYFNQIFQTGVFSIHHQ